MTPDSPGLKSLKELISEFDHRGRHSESAKLRLAADELEQALQNLAAEERAGQILRAAAEKAEAELDRVTKERDALRAAMQEFVDRCDRGEVRSRRTYDKFKELLK